MATYHVRIYEDDGTFYDDDETFYSYEEAEDHAGYLEGCEITGAEILGRYDSSYETGRYEIIED